MFLLIPYLITNPNKISKVGVLLGIQRRNVTYSKYNKH